jgi:SAM-dependent methyltransferase
MPDAMNIGSGEDPQAEKLFKQLLLGTPEPRVLELGTMRWDEGFATHHQAWAPHASQYVMSDVTDGLDVDVVADAHDLAPFATSSFDAYIAVSVYEHLRQPWVAAQAAHRVLANGGLLLVFTHQTFPIHGYPSDYYRFTDVGLASLFEDVGFEVLDHGYQYPCQIIPTAEVTRWNPGAPAFLNVTVAARCHK